MALFRWVWFLRLAIGTTSLLLILPSSTETNEDESFDYNNLAELYKFRVFKSIFIFSNEMICWRRENHENNCWRRDDYWVVSLLGQLISEKPASLPMWTLSNLAFSALEALSTPHFGIYSLGPLSALQFELFTGWKAQIGAHLTGPGVKMPNWSALIGEG